MDSVESVETFAYQPLPLAIDRFRPETGACVVVVTVSIPGPPEAEPPALMARFTRKSVGAAAHLLGEGSFRVEGEGAQRVAQGRVELEDGVWDLTVLAVDPGSGVSRIFKGKIASLPSGAALQLSDVVLAHLLEPLPFATQASYDAPYIIGGFRVAPRATDVLPRGEPLRLFFEIYGGAPPYHVVYQLEGQEDDGRWRALGRPQEREATTRGQGFELPTSASWPFGPYRMRIRVTDGGGAAAEGVAAFALVAAPAAPDATAPAPIVREP